MLVVVGGGAVVVAVVNDLVVTVGLVAVAVAVADIADMADAAVVVVAGFQRSLNWILKMLMGFVGFVVFYKGFRNVCTRFSRGCHGMLKSFKIPLQSFEILRKTLIPSKSFEIQRNSFKILFFKIPLNPSRSCQTL